MMLKIRLSTISDLNEIAMIFDKARDFMRQNGNPDQWNKNYPTYQTALDDLHNNIGYVCEDSTNGKILGYFALMDYDKCYEKMLTGKWLNDKAYKVVHRLATTPNLGIGSFILDYLSEKYNNIKIDTKDTNIPMQNLLIKKGFIRCGTVMLDSGLRVAFQKYTNEI